MTFALSGNIITQSGTDANPSGLGAIAGVTTQSVGTGSRIRTIYTIPAGRQLAITGTLTHDTDQYLILFSDNSANTGALTKVLITGVYNYGIKANGQPSRLSGISIPSDPGTWWSPAIVSSGTNGNAILVTGSGARFNMQGGQMDGALTIGYGNSAGGTITSGTVVIRDDGITNGTNWLTRILTPNIAFNNYTMIGGSLSIGANTAGQTFSISRPGAGGVAYWMQTQSVTPTRLKDYTVGEGYDVGIALYSDGAGGVTCTPVISQNSAVGTAVNMRGGETDSAAYISNAGYHAFLRTISTSITTESGLADGFIYVGDTNNGQRKNLNSIDDTPDKIYIGTITSGALSAWSKIGGGGLTYTNNYEIISGIVNVVRNSTNARGISNQGIWRKDLRGLSDVEGEDRFNFYVWSYANEYKVINQSLAGTGTLVIKDKVFVDSGVTLSNSAALAKLVSSFTVNTSTNTITVTASSTLDDVYDAMKAYKCQAVKANLEYPTISTQPVTASGSGLVTAMNIVINSGVTLSNGAKFINITTSGTVTNAGALSATITGSVTTTGTFTSGASVIGNVSQATPTSLSGVTINGNLTYNTNTPITIALTNTTITGTVSNSGTGLVTISLGNSTLGTVGSNIATRPVTSLTLNGLTAGSQIYIENGSGAQVAYVASSGTSYTIDTTGYTGTWLWKVTNYGYTSQIGTHLPAIASTTVSVFLSVDLFITEPDKATVAAYTTLETLDKLYDYSAYYETTNAGIFYTRVVIKAGTAASASSYDVVLVDTGDAWTFTGTVLTINSTTTLASGTIISGALYTAGTVTLTAAQTNTSITASVLQDTPTDLSGMVITGTLTYNTATDTTVTFTDCVVTGEISNLDAGIVKVFKAGTSLWFTAGTNVLVRANVTITTASGLALTTAVLANGVDDLGWVPQDTARVLEVAETDTFSIYAIAYGYQAALFSAAANDPTTFILALNPDVFVDTTLDTTIRDTIVASFYSYRDDNFRFPLTINTDLREYSTAQVMNALQYYVVTQGYWFGTAVVFGAPINGFTFIQGGVYIADSNYFFKVDDSVTTPTNLGYLLPVVIGVDPAVYVAYPTYSTVELNTSDIVMQYAPWTLLTAEISTTDKADIALETVAAMNAAPPDVNVAKMNGATVLGTGIADDLWRG